ncbi:SidC homolog [Legionella beliardensis]|uniref:SidC homolog n=1 Tax=Legionella beliardensis TaxID=91822 RepID=A0A378I1Q9_9GAMM|nr:hypothetical protein [Legionella beliardensis]STX28615.1 SidC homolog [Legionella beliardensis]
MYSKNIPLSENDSTIKDLSRLEEVFSILQIYSEGFNPTFFKKEDLLSLSLTSKTLYSTVAPELLQREAQKLLAHVVLGEQDEAQRMLEKNPELLLIRQETLDYSGRTIIGTAFQAALGAGDKPMWEMILPYFESLEEGEALRQFQEQFPDGIENDKDDVSAAALKDYYHKLAIAIVNDTDHGQSALEAFRRAITCQEKITQGKHFNLKHLIAVHKAYIANFNVLLNWKNRDLFWQKIVGYVQRQVTAYDAQIHASVINNVLEDENSFRRTFKLEGGQFFPLLADSGLGFNFACFSYSTACTWTRGGGGGGQPMLSALKNYIEQKQAHLRELESQLSHECTISPMDMGSN